MQGSAHFGRSRNSMNPATSQRQMGRSILAVLTGMFAAIVLTLATDLVLHKLRVFPPFAERAPDKLLALATGYRVIFGVGASYLTAYLAPYRPMAHAMIGGAFGFLASLAGAIATWNGGPAYEPHWYPGSLVVLALPQAWIGGWLRSRELEGR
jgi:hypothetical protein